MSELTIKLRNPEGLKDALKKAQESTRTRLQKALLIGALMVEATAKQPPTPHDTGRLWSSITHEEMQDRHGNPTVLVGTNVFYAPFLEFGTKYIRARHFLRNSLQKHSPSIVRMIESALGRPL